MGNIDDALEDQAERYTEHTMKLAKQLDAIEDIVRPRDRETIVEAVRRVLGKPALSRKRRALRTIRVASYILTRKQERLVLSS
jgi:hypothetical protein